MSNRAIVSQITETEYKSGKSCKTVHISDSDGIVTVDLGELTDTDTFFENELDLLGELLNWAKDYGNSYLDSLFNWITSDEKGMSIDGTWYDWDEIKEIFNSHWDNE